MNIRLASWRPASGRWLPVWLAVIMAGCSTGMDQVEESGDDGDAEVNDSSRVGDSTAATNSPTATSPPAAASSLAAPADSESQALRTVQVPAGTTLTFALDQGLNTGTIQAGETFSATLGEPIVVDGATLFPAGATAMGRVTDAQRAGRVRGRASIRLVMTEMSRGGEAVGISTLPFEATAAGSTGEDAVTIGAGAGIGAAIGAALGGGDGAALGAVIGGGSGTGVVLATRGDEIELDAGTQINFQLSEPIEINQ